MTKLPALLLASIVCLSNTHRAHAEDYDKAARATPWIWHDERASIIYSVFRFPREYRVELIRPMDKFDLTIRLLKDGKEIHTWQGHGRTVFALSGDVLVHADFNPSSSGCSLVAYDLKKREPLWKSSLKGLGPIPHTAYSNAVNLDVVNFEVVRVFGNEAAGRYLEFVDLKTGKTVGHHVYK
jgi:hypothetical protein